MFLHDVTFSRMNAGADAYFQSSGRVVDGDGCADGTGGTVENRNATLLIHSEIPPSEQVRFAHHVGCELLRGRGRTCSRPTFWLAGRVDGHIKNCGQYTIHRRWLTNARQKLLNLTEYRLLITHKWQVIGAGQFDEFGAWNLFREVSAFFHP